MADDACIVPAALIRCNCTLNVILLFTVVTLISTENVPVDVPRVPGSPSAVYPLLISVALPATATDMVPDVPVNVSSSLLKSAPPVKSEFVLER